MLLLGLFSREARWLLAAQGHSFSLSGASWLQCSLIPSLSWGDVDIQSSQHRALERSGRIGRDKGGWAQPPEISHPQLCPVLGFVHQSPGGGRGRWGGVGSWAVKETL